MLSPKHHILYWVVSFLTLPLSALRKYLTDRGLVSGIIDDLEYPLVGLVFYFLSRWAMVLPEEAKQRAEQEVKFSGLVTPVQPEEPEKEPVTETAANANIKVNGNGNNRSKNARKRFARGQNKARGQNGNNSNQDKNNSNKNNSNKNSSNPNGKARSNRNRTLTPPVRLDLNKISKRRLLRKTLVTWDESIKRAVSYFVHHFLEELYFLSLILLFTSAKLPGLEESPGGDYGQMAARVLITFMTLGTLEPLRCSRWDIEACGLGMFTYCCVFCDEGPGPWASVEMGAMGLCVMGALIECLLWIKVGHFACWPALWLTSDNISVSDMLIRISALSPLIDIVETYTRYSHKLFVATTYLIFPYIMGILLQALSDAGKHGTWSDTEGFGQGARSVKNGTGLG
ncbi:hypothetical protein HYE67_008559 [Fusarium culmorum]|uniref:Uncharacterized protein n=1 Tax=Fusarium culmorum TaxID=5516 RepID=A0A2T4HA48_FUSCU|nr:hypothetical protein FCULG_00003255 [Fusarium culmorum]QPC66328.1 hypothetical protein HYE67_008559 [Fusarium culmorum]